MFRSTVASLAAAVLLLAGSAHAQSRLARLEEQAKNVKGHTMTTDSLRFNGFTHQNGDRPDESHSKGIAVHWPDGHVTHGIEKHIEDLKAMFVYAPDTRITVHPIKFGAGDWTSVVGEMEGTFTKPMPLADGKQLPPTGKAFKLTMCTVGHWKNGVMDEEYLFWDNQTFMKQIGLAQ